MSGQAVLQTRALHKRFGDVHAVRGLDLVVREGEILGFLGPNGAGKTTSLRMLAGLLRPDGGRIGIGPGHVPPSDSRARRHIGVCPQENVVYPELTVRENLEYVASMYRVSRTVRRRRATQIMARLGLRDKEKAQAEKLSGGLKRRLTIGMALMNDPQIVFLDEPEAGLDPQSRVAVRTFIRGLARHRTVVLTSHNMDEVDRVVDRVVIMDDGRLVADGTPQGLKDRYGRGDRIEVRLMQADVAPVADALRARGVPGVQHDGQAVTVGGHDLVARIPDILQWVRDADGDIQDVRYRANTLEDVFIALTGRGLRE